ncbi:calcium-binding protein [Rhodobacter calidifons]|uniref:Calcium-binding protein n=1 Tax=Rhodobacter calidifons TaxID=2715277 RepID=A0ABX0G9H7_9RHOB|nr:calcium-binding protein [Rhodobacter calidifons]NHB77523.1 calcium-binding protein [Rhodobacter calidifons]
MADIIITTTSTTPRNLGSGDNALVAPAGVLATAGTAMVRTGTSSARPTLTVLGTIWSGGVDPSVRATGDAEITVGAGGSITGAREDGIYATAAAPGVEGALRLVNDGIITARFDGIDLDAVNLDLDNAGSVRSHLDAGIEAQGFAHRIVNAGTIAGVNGIDATATAVTHVLNHGHIGGSAAAMVLRGGHAVVENRGSLGGNVYMLTETGFFDGRGGGAAAVYGGNGDYAMFGGAADDTLSGGARQDDLRGGAGDDNLSGQDGDDLLSGGNGDDNAFGGGGNDTILGGTGDDRLAGDDGNDSLTGGTGDDSLTGWNGNDTLDAGAGDDLIDGGAGTDTLVFRTASAVTVDLEVQEGQNTGQGFDRILGIENVTGGAGNDRLGGNASRNVLVGGIGDDILAGRAGNDFLIGGLGNDRLNGGAASDTFVFRLRAGADTVEDFQNGLDRLDVRGLAASLADVTVAQSGANTVLSAGGVQITLIGVAAGQIDASDFLF